MGLFNLKIGKNKKGDDMMEEKNEEQLQQMVPPLPPPELSNYEELIKENNELKEILARQKNKIVILHISAKDSERANFLCEHIIHLVEILGDDFNIEEQHTLNIDAYEDGVYEDDEEVPRQTRLDNFYDNLKKDINTDY